jgi:hypothetical protein
MSDIGIAPKIRKRIGGIDAGLNHDIVIVIKTADDAPAPQSTAWSKTIHFELQDASGNVLEWVNTTTLMSAVASDTSTAGTASVDTATPTVVKGVGSVVLSGDAQDWLDTETALCTIDGTLNGFALTEKVFTRTYTA